MANYVSNCVICTKRFFEEFFLDDNPFGDDARPEEPFITFRKLFGCASYHDFDSGYSASIYNGFGFYWEERPDERMKIKFLTRWQYPIKVIIKALELCKEELEWYACEENHIYVSRFRWKNAGIEECVLPLNDNYDDWDEENEQRLENIMAGRDCDDSVWNYLPFCSSTWKIWPSTDNFSRYDGVSAVYVKEPDWATLKEATH